MPSRLRKPLSDIAAGVVAWSGIWFSVATLQGLVGTPHETYAFASLVIISGVIGSVMFWWFLRDRNEVDLDRLLQDVQTTTKETREAAERAADAAERAADAAEEQLELARRAN